MSRQNSLKLVPEKFPANAADLKDSSTEIKAIVSGAVSDQERAEIKALTSGAAVRWYLSDAFANIITNEDEQGIEILKTITRVCFNHLIELNKVASNSDKVPFEQLLKDSENIIQLLTYAGYQTDVNRMLDLLHMTKNFVRIKEGFRPALAKMACIEWIKYFDTKLKTWAEGKIDFELIEENTKTYRFEPPTAEEIKVSSPAVNPLTGEAKASSNTEESDRLYAELLQQQFAQETLLRTNAQTTQTLTSPPERKLSDNSLGTLAVTDEALARQLEEQFAAEARAQTFESVERVQSSNPRRETKLSDLLMGASGGSGHQFQLQLEALWPQTNKSQETKVDSHSLSIGQAVETKVENNSLRKRVTLKINEKYKDQVDKLIQETQLTLGSAFDGGDCFFDSMAQALLAQNIYIPEDIDEPTNDPAKKLRVLCNKYMKSRLIKNEWVRDAMNKDSKAGGQNYNECLTSIQFTQPEMEMNKDQNMLGGLSTWGRFAIEGVMICEKLNVRLHVIELNTATGQLVPCHYLVQGSISKAIDGKEVNYEDPKLVHIVVAHFHYVPLLNHKTFQKKPESKRVLRADTKEVKQPKNSGTFDEKTMEEQFKSLRAVYNIDSCNLQMLKDRRYQELLTTNSPKVFQLIVSENNSDINNHFRLMNATFPQLPELSANEKIKIANIYLTESVKRLLLNTGQISIDAAILEGCRWISFHLLQGNDAASFQWLHDWCKTEIQKEQSEEFYAALDSILENLESGKNHWALSQILMLRGKNHLSCNKLEKAKDFFNNIKDEDYLSLSIDNLIILVNFYLQEASDAEIDRLIAIFLFTLPLTFEINALTYKLLLHDYQLIDEKTELPYQAADFNELTRLWKRNPVLCDETQVILAKKLLDKTFAGESIPTTILTNNIANQIYSKNVIKKMKEYIYWISAEKMNADRDAFDGMVSQNFAGIVYLFRGIFYYSENPPRYREASLAFDSAIKLDNIDSMRWRAYMHKNGYDGPVNLEAAKALSELARVTMLSIKDENQRRLKQLSLKPDNGYGVGNHELYFPDNLDDRSYFDEFGFSIPENLMLTNKFSNEGGLLDNELWKTANEKLNENNFRKAAYYFRWLQFIYRKKNGQDKEGYNKATLELRFIAFKCHDIEVFYHVYLGCDLMVDFKRLLNDHLPLVFNLALRDPLLSLKESARLLQSNCVDYEKLTVRYLNYLANELRTHANSINKQRWPKVWLQWFLKNISQKSSRADYLEEWFNLYFKDDSKIADNEDLGINATVAAILFKPLSILVAGDFKCPENRVLCHALLGRIAIRFSPAEVEHHFNTQKIPLDSYFNLSFETLSAIVHYQVQMTKETTEPKAPRGSAGSSQASKSHPALHASLICLHLRYEDDLLKHIAYNLLRGLNHLVNVGVAFDQVLFENLRATYLANNPQLVADLKEISKNFQGLVEDVLSGDSKKFQKLTRRLLTIKYTYADNDLIWLKKLIKEKTKSKVGPQPAAESKTQAKDESTTESKVESSTKAESKIDTKAESKIENKTEDKTEAQIAEETAKGAAWMLKGFLYVNKLDGPEYDLTAEDKDLTQVELNIHRYQAAKKAYSEAIQLGNSDACDLLEELLTTQPNNQDSLYHALVKSKRELKPATEKLVFSISSKSSEQKSLLETKTIPLNITNLNQLVKENKEDQDNTIRPLDDEEDNAVESPPAGIVAAQLSLTPARVSISRGQTLFGDGGAGALAATDMSAKDQQALSLIFKNYLSTP